VIFQGRKKNTCMIKRAAGGIYSSPKTSRRIHKIATARYQVSGTEIAGIGMEI
jgi:hypothetical protein